MTRPRLDWSSDDVAMQGHGDAMATPLAVGTAVDHFTIMRLLSRGGMGEVYLARDVRLGRRVALKLIRAEHIGSADAMDRLLYEARTTAKFSHPNIVTVHAVGEHDGRPYIALEYLEGVNLRARVDERRLSLQEVLRLVVDMTAALAEAHDHHVLHLDLKPENVVVARDGRLRIVDFGLARSVAATRSARDSKGSDIADETTSDLVAPGVPEELQGWGSASYMAPEQWRREQMTAAADVWAVGVITFELCSGRLPFDEADFTQLGQAVSSELPAPALRRYSDVPPLLCDWVGRCLAKNSADRPTARELRVALEGMLSTSTVNIGEDDSPFRGLLAFTERDADLFFGREAEIAAFVERMRLAPVLAVLGPSGVGKTSFLRAGVVPRLREQGRWQVLHLRPGPEPFMALATRILHCEDGFDGPEDPQSLSLIAGEPAPVSDALRDVHAVRSLAKRLHETPHQLALELRALADERGMRVLLVVDQLEELFTMVDDAELRSRFMRSICSAADDAAEPVRVVLSARDDFLGRLVTGPAVREALRDLTVIQPLDRTSLEDLLRRPVAAVGYRYEEDALVGDMVAAVYGEAASLPLLQFAAQRLWEERHVGRKLLLRSAYEQMGGVEGALAGHASKVLDALSPTEIELARSLLLRLVTSERTRRVASRADVLDGLSLEATDVLTRLVLARLVTVRRKRPVEGAEVMLELAHESLVHTWATLARWLDANRGEQAFVTEMTDAATLWDRRGRRSQELWRDDALAEAARMARRSGSNLPRVAQEFLQAASKRQDRGARQRAAVIAIAIASLVVVAVVLALGKREADVQRGAAQQQRAQALREGARAALGQGHVLEARAKLRVALEQADSPAARALWWQLEADPRRWSKELSSLVHSVAFSSAANMLAAGCLDGVVYLFDVTTRKITTLRGHEDQVSQVAFSHDGRWLVSGSYDHTVRVWDLATRAQRHLLQGHDARLWGLAVSADDEYVASAGEDKTIRVWSMADGKPVVTIDDGVAVSTRLSFDAGGKLAFVGADHRVRLYDVEQRRETQSLVGHTAVVWAVAFSPDGRFLVTGSEDKTARVWDVAAGRALHVLSGHRASVFGVDFSPDGQLVATAGGDARIELWDVATGQHRRSLGGHDGGVQSVAFAPDGRSLASSGADHTVRVWNTGVPERHSRHHGHDKGVIGVSFSADGKQLATASYDRTVRIWDVATGGTSRVLRGHEGTVYNVAFGPDGRRLASADLGGRVHIWDVASWSEERTLRHQGAVRGVAFHPDGERLATGGGESAVQLWDVISGERTVGFEGDAAPTSDVAFDAAGERIAAAGWDRAARIWRVTDGKPLHVFDGHDDGVDGVAFSPDGNWLATGSFDGKVRLWPLSGDEPRVLGSHDGRAYWLAYHPDGKRLVTASSDGTAKLWFVDEERHLTVDAHGSEVNVARFSVDGRLWASTSDDRTVRLWDSVTGRPFWRAPALVGAQLLSHRGWETLDGSGRRAPESKWAAALEQEALVASQSADGHFLCYRTYDGGAALWSLRSDTRTWHRSGDVEQAVAFDGGCVLRLSDPSRALVVEGRSEKEVAHDGVSAVGAVGSVVLLASKNQVQSIDLSDGQRRSLAVSVGVSAVTASAAGIIVGYRDGNLELLGFDDERRTPSFEGVPASPARVVLAGPRGTLIAGYDSGLLGMWSLEDGSRLAATRLHGKVSHVRIVDRRLYAVSDLGVFVAWSLEPFDRAYCELLSQVWHDVPVVWSGGQALRRVPPADHSCHEQR